MQPSAPQIQPLTTHPSVPSTQRHRPPTGYGLSHPAPAPRAPEAVVPEACRSLARLASPLVQGDDRLRLFLRALEDLDDAQRLTLRQHVEVWVGQMLALGASDLDAGGEATVGFVWFRIDGDKRPRQELGTRTIDEMNVLLLNLLTERQQQVLFAERSLDFSYQLQREGKAQRFRATLYFDAEHLALNMRAIAAEIRPLKSMRFSPVVERGLMFRHVRDGLTLVTGVTGSGKSTTLDAIVDANNRDVAGHIIIIAKPIEYVHPSQRSLVRHREVGRDVGSFKDGITQALRQDPDIVVIGEIRDPVTISAALEITDSGHKVFSTLHTSSAVESIARIIAEYPPNEQTRVRHRLAEVLRCVISQKLCPKVGGGRILAKEVLWMTPSSRAAIKNGNEAEIYQMMWEGRREGQTTLEQDLFGLVQQRLITPETAVDYANNKRRLQQLMT